MIVSMRENNEDFFFFNPKNHRFFLTSSILAGLRKKEKMVVEVSEFHIKVCKHFKRERE